MEMKSNILDCIFLPTQKIIMKEVDFSWKEVLETSFSIRWEAAQMRCLMAGGEHPALDDAELTFCASLLLPKYHLSSLGR